MPGLGGISVFPSPFSWNIRSRLSMISVIGRFTCSTSCLERYRSDSKFIVRIESQIQPVLAIAGRLGGLSFAPCCSMANEQRHRNKSVKGHPTVVPRNGYVGSRTQDPEGYV